MDLKITKKNRNLVQNSLGGHSCCHVNTNCKSCLLIFVSKRNQLCTCLYIIAKTTIKTHFLSIYLLPKITKISKKNQKWPRLPYLLTWQHKLFIMFINIFLKTQTTLNMLIHHSKNNNSDSFLVNLFAPSNTKLCLTFVHSDLLSECLTKTFPPEFDYRRYALPYALRSKWLHKSECTKVAW